MTKRKSKQVSPFESGRPRRSRGGSSKKSGDMLRQLQGLQQEMLEAQEEIAERTFTVTAGGGAVTVVITGDKRLQSLTMAPEVVDPDDIEMLQDLVIAAINEGMDQVDQAAADRMGDFTAGLGIQDLL